MSKYFVKKAFVGRESNLYIMLTYALVGDNWSASYSECFIPKENLSYPVDRKLGGAIACLDMMAKRNILAPSWN